MLNKIRLVGKILPFDHERKNSVNPSILYFNLLVSSPNNLLIVVRCSAQKSLVFKEEEKLSELKRNDLLLSDGFVEVKGYLKNDESSRQFLVKITDLSIKDEIDDFDEIDILSSNQVRLLGRIIEIDLRKSYSNNIEEDDNIYDVEKNSPNDFGKLISFKISLGKEEDEDKLFFCRVQDNLVSKFLEEDFKKGDVVFVRGFLQTKKISQERRNFRISSIVCQSITLLDSYFSREFYDVNFRTISGVIRKIDFNNSDRDDKS